MDEQIGLRFDWNEASGDRVTAILGLDARTVNDGSAIWDAVAICIGEAAVVLRAEIDTAEIIIAREAVPFGEGWKSIPSFDFAVGKSLGWSWIGINSQGYTDSFTLAFDPDGLDPRCTFVTSGCTGLYCYDLVRRHV